MESLGAEVREVGNFGQTSEATKRDALVLWVSVPRTKVRLLILEQRYLLKTQPWTDQLQRARRKSQ